MTFAQPADEQLYHHLSRHKQGGRELPARVIAQYSGYDIATVGKSMARLVRAGLVKNRLEVYQGHLCWWYWREN